DRMERHRQLHDAEAGAEMPAGDGDGIDHLAAQLRRELLQLVARQRFQRVGRIDSVEQGRERLIGHADPLPAKGRSKSRSRAQSLQRAQAVARNSVAIWAAVVLSAAGGSEYHCVTPAKAGVQ